MSEAICNKVHRESLINLVAICLTLLYPFLDSIFESNLQLLYVDVILSRISFVPRGLVDLRIRAIVHRNALVFQLLAKTVDLISKNFVRKSPLNVFDYH